MIRLHSLVQTLNSQMTMAFVMGECGEDITSTSKRRDRIFVKSNGVSTTGKLSCHDDGQTKSESKNARTDCAFGPKEHSNATCGVSSGSANEHMLWINALAIGFVLVVGAVCLSGIFGHEEGVTWPMMSSLLRKGMAALIHSDLFYFGTLGVFMLVCTATSVYNGHSLLTARTLRFFRYLAREQELQYRRQKGPAEERKARLYQQQAGAAGYIESSMCACDEDFPLVRIMLVIAHPDDEAMFFAPTLQTMAQSSKFFQITLVCLSSGNWSGLGTIRKEELITCVTGFGIPAEAVEIFDMAELKDGFHDWDPAAVGKVVQDAINRHDPHVVLTFDDHGVSGHPNHRCTFLGVRNVHKSIAMQWMQNSGGINATTRDEATKSKTSKEQELLIPSGSSSSDITDARTEDSNVNNSLSEAARTRSSKPITCETDTTGQKLHSPHLGSAVIPPVAFFALRSHQSNIAKFMGPLAIIQACISSKNQNMDAITSLTPFAAIRGMTHHWSQFVWYRLLFVLFSGYSYCNQFVQLV